jgi:hypothetical protein
MGVAGSGRGAGMAKQGLDMPQAQAGLEQVGGKTVAEAMDRDFFLIAQAVTTAFMACWVPPVFMWVVAWRIVFSDPR